MNALSIRQVVHVVEDPKAAALWYRAVLKLERQKLQEADGFVFLACEGVELGFQPADPEHNAASGSPVVYWAVDDLDAVREQFLSHGAAAWRGPLVIGPGRRICQVKDPFGTVVGLDGP